MFGSYIEFSLSDWFLSRVARASVQWKRHARGFGLVSPSADGLADLAEPNNPVRFLSRSWFLWTFRTSISEICAGFLAFLTTVRIRAVSIIALTIRATVPLSTTVVAALSFTTREVG